MNVWTKTAALAALGVWMLAPGVARAQDHGGGHGMHGADEHAKPAKPDAKAMPNCPVMGEPVDFTIKTMTDDGPVYFCCDGCIGKYKKNPAKYAAKTAAQRTALEKRDRVQVNCPISGKPIDGKTFAMVDGRGVSFCCQRCVAQYEKDPSRFKAKLADSYTYQTQCPVGGEKIDATSYVDLPTGQRIYLCCDGCADKLLKNPEKYAPALAGQGVNIDVEKIKAKGKPEAGHHDGHDHDHP